VYIYVDGEKYDGEWDNDLRNGWGEAFYTNNSQYKGYWKNGTKCGHGSFRTIEHYYQGEFLANLKNGRGVLRWTHVATAEQPLEVSSFSTFFFTCVV
jgi:hypothetical protein